jgi:uncharacterized coiled-coil protein SlyX
VSALEGNTIEITSANFSGLTQLCEEFGFERLRGKLSEFPLRPGTAAEEAEARMRIAALEEKAEQHNRAIAMLKDQFVQLLADIGQLAGGMGALSDEISAEQSQIGADLSAEFGELRREVLALKVKVGAIAAPPAARPPAPNQRSPATPVKMPVAPPPPAQSPAPAPSPARSPSLTAPGQIDSLIISDFRLPGDLHKGSAENNSNCCGGAAGMVSGLPNSTDSATATQTH